LLTAKGLGDEDPLRLDLGGASLDNADLVDAATDRRLLVSPSRSLPFVRELGRSAGTLRGADSSDGVDEVVAEDGESKSGVDMEGLSDRRAEICGVEMGVGVLL
jgi:hypothetical protein